MSDSEDVPRRGRLPPLGTSEGEITSVDRTPRKKKKKPPTTEATDKDTPRRVPSRPLPPNSARSLPHSDAETETSRSFREIPPHPRRKKPKATVTADDTLEDIEDVSEQIAETPRPKKKRRPKNTESQEELVENGHTPSGGQATDRSSVRGITTDRSGADKPKRKKKKKVGLTEPPVASGVGLEAELHELEEDIVTDSTESFEENKYGALAVMRSEPINKIFIEQRSGFKTANKEKIARQRANQQLRAITVNDTQITKSTIQFAISSHRVFKTIVLFLQGLLAGICLWQIITVYMLSKQGYDVLLLQYTDLAMPVQCMYYFLLALSTVAVFDKNDIARPEKKFILRSVTMQTTAIACFFYLAGLVLSLSIANIDDKIGLFDIKPELWLDEAARDRELKTWVILNMVRGLMPMLGWLVISISPKSDRLIKNLLKADENIIEGVGEMDEEPEVHSTGAV